MKCMFCHAEKPIVVDSRHDDGEVVRRYQCRQCDKRFSTREVYTTGDPMHRYRKREQVANPRMYYTVYDAKTDEVLAIGSASECANIIGIALQTFYKNCSLSKRGKCFKYFILAENQKDLEDLN